LALEKYVARSSDGNIFVDTSKKFSWPENCGNELLVHTLLRPSNIGTICALQHRFCCAYWRARRNFSGTYRIHAGSKNDQINSRHRSAPVQWL